MFLLMKLVFGQIKLRTNIYELPINIHVGEIQINHGFEVEIFDGNYFDIIDEYNSLYSDLIDIYGSEDINKLIEICQTVLKNNISNQFYVSVTTTQVRKGHMTNVQIKKYTEPYHCEGEILQIFNFILKSTPNRFKVVDFDYNIIGYSKTFKSAKDIFRIRYPYMEESLIKNFIYKHDT